MKRERTPLGRLLDVPADEERLQASWTKVSARLGPRKRSWVAPAAAVAALAAAALLILAWPPAPPTALSTADGRPVETVLTGSPQDARTVALSDASELTLTAGTEVEALESSSTRLALALRRGRARFSVTPGGPRRWTVDAGPVTVEVVGTIFTVERTETSVDVSVERGRVVVRGEGVPDGVRSLAAGEALHVALEIARLDPRPEVREPGLTPAIEPSLEVDHAVEAIAPAARPVEPTVGSEVEPAEAPARTAESLLAEADAARRAGHVDEALALLAEAAGRHEEGASLAALTRGRLLLERGRPDEAARDLRRALRGDLPPMLAESAEARLVEALARSGDVEGARQIADAYLRAYPEGQWRARVEELVR